MKKEISIEDILKNVERIKQNGGVGEHYAKYANLPEQQIDRRAINQKKIDTINYYFDKYKVIIIK